MLASNEVADHGAGFRPEPGATGPGSVGAGVAGWLTRVSLDVWVLIAGLAAIIVPTMSAVARDSWSTEQGAHGPIVLATGIWLLARQWPRDPGVTQRGSGIAVLVMLALLLPAYIFFRVTQIVELEGIAMFGIALTVLYSLIGLPAMQRIWFPLFYLAFILPPPDTVVAAITQPLKIGISEAAIALLYRLGYPIGGAGVTIQIDQYQLLVAAACSGMNSLISLFALSLFYVYMRHRLHWQYALLLVTIIVPVAIFANFVRVVILILLTYYAGEAVAQGFVHGFAGIVMFIIAILTIFLFDRLVHPVWLRVFPERTP